ncbi:MAG: HD-GYP domain-containing protein [Armatimonadetes bacterium]|nr:HD-GYP domain-containing protein [Armatimonadota bacterium]
MLVPILGASMTPELLNALPMPAFMFADSGRVISQNPIADIMFGQSNLDGVYFGLDMIAFQLSRLPDQELQRHLTIGDRTILQSFFADSEKHWFSICQDVTIWMETRTEFPDSIPNPVFEVAFDGVLQYANPSARTQWPDLEEMGIDHPILRSADIAEQVSMDRPGWSMLKEVAYDSKIFLLAISNPIHTRLIRVYALDLTDQKQLELDLEDSQLEVIYRLARAAELRDDETGQHIMRMSEFSAILARHLGWNVGDVSQIRRAAVLHDIGKIGVPDAILQKEGPLNEDEFEIVKSHTTLGAKLLSGTSIAVLDMAQRIALTHHERWDGRGYPNGLAGKDIPIEGRICAVADVFDALTRSRRYKAAWSIEEAMDEIRRVNGTQFDPAVVNALDEALEEIIVAKDLFYRSPLDLSGRKIA